MRLADDLQDFCEHFASGRAATGNLAGTGCAGAATLEVRGYKSGRTMSFPVVVVDCQGVRYLVAMLDQKSNWVRDLRADGHAVLRHGQSEDISLVEDLLR
jgi:hypothetical protein